MDFLGETMGRPLPHGAEGPASLVDSAALYHFGGWNISHKKAEMIL